MNNILSLVGAQVMSFVDGDYRDYLKHKNLMSEDAKDDQVTTMEILEGLDALTDENQDPSELKKGVETFQKLRTPKDDETSRDKTRKDKTSRDDKEIYG